MDALERRNLTAAEFHGLAEVPPELEWFANITNERHLRRQMPFIGDSNVIQARPTQSWLAAS